MCVQKGHLPVRTACTMPVGLLGLPTSWLHDLVMNLPAHGKFCLFSTCWQLAKQVVLSAPKVALQMDQRAPTDVLLSSRIIGKILASRQELRLVVTQRGPQPFPMQLTSRVTELELGYWGAGPPSEWLEWSSFSNLQHLEMTSSIVCLADLQGLCNACNAGHLQQLQKLTCCLWDKDSLLAQTFSLDFQPVMRCLGSRVTYVYTNGASFTTHLHELTALKQVDIACTLGSDGLAALCNHPSLETVCVFGRLELEKDLSWHPCNFQVLKLDENDHGATVEDLSRLPLRDLQEIHVYGKVKFANYMVWDGNIPYARSGGQSLRIADGTFLSKLHLWSSTDCENGGELCFTAYNLPVDTVSIISRLQVRCRLIIACSDKPGLVPALWRSLPSFISSIRIEQLSDDAWHNIWVNIPDTVLHVEVRSPKYMRDCRYDVDARCDMVTHTPLHVMSLSLQVFDPQFWAGLKAAKLRRAARTHLRFQLVCDGML